MVQNIKMEKHFENCQGECNGQQKRTFDLNSSAEFLNSYSNRHLQKGHRFGLHAEYSAVWRCEFCRAFLNKKILKAFLSSPKSKRKVARGFVRLEGLGEVRWGGWYLAQIASAIGGDPVRNASSRGEWIWRGGGHSINAVAGFQVSHLCTQLQPHTDSCATVALVSLLVNVTWDDCTVQTVGILCSFEQSKMWVKNLVALPTYP